MEQSFGDLLREKTTKALDAKTEKEEDRVERSTQEEQTRQEAERQAIEAFVDSEIEKAITKITEQASSRANSGAKYSDTTWEFRYDEQGRLFSRQSNKI
ncbi:MAG: hypothetical protein WDN66_03945 [Candidatus Saccharibacteria bacterium]